MPLTVDDIPADMVIFMSDIKDAGFCAIGARSWFTANGLDFRAMMRNGINGRELFATNDAYATRVMTARIARMNTHG